MTDGSHQFQYDAEGNLILRTEIATGNYTEYDFDHRNRLVRATTKSAGGIILEKVTNVYDLLDRRIARSVDIDGAGPQSPTTTHTIFDREHAWADFDSTGQLIARYLVGDRTDELLARWRPAEGTTWYLTDHLGTIRDLANQAGSLINTLTYDSFGSILSQSNPSVSDRFTYTGREYDTELGLYYYRARFYDPSLGRFISQDPIGFAAGDVNLYRYVANNPLGATDPSGQLALTEYVHKLGSGPVGALVLNNTFNCFMFEALVWSASTLIVEQVTGEAAKPTLNDAASISLGVISCTMFPTSAAAQGIFLLLSETLYLYATGASPEQIATTALMHTLGISGGSGISRHSARSFSRFSDGLEVRLIPPAKRNSGVTILGHNPDYIEVADDLGGRRFHIPKDVQASMTPEELWAANEKFLDRTIIRGDDIVLSTPASLVRPNTFLARELNHLVNVRKAYRISEDGLRLIRLAN